MSVACVDLPSLPLQLVWRSSPSWRSLPVVVVAEDRPGAEVLWACERARALRVLPGQRYAHALSLCAGLRAQVVAPEAIAAAVEELARILSRVAPRIEPAGDPRRAPTRRPQAGAHAPQEAGTFWLDGAGMGRLHESGQAWAQAIALAVQAAGFTASVVVGTSRFATYAVARAASAAARPQVIVFASEAQERRAARAVPLVRLEVAPALREALARLGVLTLGQLEQLPAAGLLERYGEEGHRLVQLARGERWDPLVPAPPPGVIEQRVLLDDEELALEALVFIVKGALDRLLGQLAARARALTALHLELRMRHSVHELETRVDCLRPAAPTLDSRGLLRLVHLRLEGAPPAAGVVEVRLWASDTPATREQLSLFLHKPARDLRVAEEALARLRAELGEDAVVTAGLREGHLPEARFGWQRLGKLGEACPRPRQEPRLVRRIFARPRALPPQSSSVRDDGWMLSGLEHGSVVRIVGPFVLSGAWWAGEVHREYHFADTRRGDCLWVYYDAQRRRWYWQGAVE